MAAQNQDSRTASVLALSAVKRLGAVLLFVLAACLQGENAPCQQNAECSQTLCFITESCSARSTCFGACRASCSASNTSCPSGQACECGLAGVRDGGCACLTADAGGP